MFRVQTKQSGCFRVDHRYVSVLVNSHYPILHVVKDRSQLLYPATLRATGIHQTLCFTVSAEDRLFS